MNIFERLKEERERMGLSQEKFGAIGGVKKLAQINYEKGERNPDSAYLAAIAVAGADVRYILEGGKRVPPPHERLEIALTTVGLPTAEAAAKALSVSLKDMRAMLAGKQPLDEALHEPMRKLGVDVRYVLAGDGGDRSQADHALNAAEAKLLRDYRASPMDVQAVICAAAAAGATRSTT